LHQEPYHADPHKCCASCSAKSVGPSTKSTTAISSRKSDGPTELRNVESTLTGNRALRGPVTLPPAGQKKTVRAHDSPPHNLERTAAALTRMNVPNINPLR